MTEASPVQQNDSDRTKIQIIKRRIKKIEQVNKEYKYLNSQLCLQVYNNRQLFLQVYYVQIEM